MARLIPFSRHEAVYLLNGYLKTLSSNLPRKVFVEQVSQDLRKMATNNGLIIDDVYRNTNGISFQMSSMESAYVGRTIRKPASRLFSEIVTLYREDRGEYEKLLEEARQMVNDHTALGNQTSAEQGRNKGVSASVEDQIRAALKTECATNKYGTTVAYICSVVENVRQSEVKEILNRSPWAKLELGRYHYIEPIVPSEAIALPEKLFVNFESPSSDEKMYDCTVPISLIYFEEKISVSSWKGLFVKCCQVLCDDYPDVFGDISIADDGKITSAQSNETELYLTCDPSVNGMINRLRQLIELCNVDYENVVIEFTRQHPDNPIDIPKTQAAKPQDQTPHTSSSSSAAPQKRTPGDGAFYRFLRDQLGLADRTCRVYVSSIWNCETFAKKHDYPTTRLFNCESHETIATAQMLLDNPDFIEINRIQHNALSAALHKLLDFIGGGIYPFCKTTEAIQQQNNPPEARLSTSRKSPHPDLASYEEVLLAHFKKGFRLGSALDLKKFRRYYEESKDAPLTVSDESLKAVLRKCGIAHEGKVFLPEVMLSEEVKSKLLAYVKKAFADGKSGIYYDALFEEFSEDFLDGCIYDAAMLREYMGHVMDDSYVFGSNQITKVGSKRISTLEEVRICLKENGCPVSVDSLCETLSHIPRDTITTILASNLEFVRNSRGNSDYFHADSLDLSNDELEGIAELISDNIRAHRYISGTELMNAIRAKFPSLYESYSMYSDIGWRDALKYKIGSRFSFKGNVISDIEDTLSMSDVFGELASSRDQITLDELVQFSEELGSGVIYFDPVYENALRVNENLFVSKSRAAFRVMETDAVLDRFCLSSYIPLADIHDFAIFPDAGFSWNAYLLESYVAFYSEKYTLLHGSFNRNCAVGAIVKKSTGFHSLDDLIVDFLALSGTALNKENALDLLVQRGYIARRSYANIEDLLIRAKAHRNRKK